MTDKEARARAKATLARSQAERELATKQPLEKRLQDPVYGMRSTLDAGANLATGSVAAPISGIAGLVGAALPGPQGQGADWVRKTQEALTWKPRTEGGAAIADTIAAPGTWLAGKGDQAGGAVTDLTGSPMLGTAVTTGIQALPMALGKAVQRPARNALAKSQNAADAKRSMNSVEDATLEAARKEGYGVPKSVVDPTLAGNTIEGIGGKAAIKQEFDLRNQKVTDKIARREAGLKASEPLSEGALKAARDRLAEPYRQVEALPGLPAPRTTSNINPSRNPYPLIGKTPKTPKELVHDWRSVNSRATELWKDYQRNAKIETLDAHKAALKEKTVIERNIEKAAIAAGRRDLVPALRAARVKIAQNYTIDRALNEGNGSVDATVIARMRDNRIPLTGGLKTIGDFARAFKPFNIEKSKVPPAGVSNLQAITGSIASVAGASALGPVGALAGAVPIVAPPIARAYVLSRQNPRTYNANPALRIGSEAATVAPWIGASGMANARRR